MRPPTGRLVRSFLSLIAAKRGARREVLRAISGQVITRYHTYISRRKALQQVASLHWLEDQKEALNHCFDTATLGLKEIKESVFRCLIMDETQLCPYCLLRGPQHIDHFLPRAAFPEFASLRINLVWVCGTCNETKGDGFVTGIRSVLNPYFDKIPQHEPLLYCSVVVEGEQLSFRFGIPNGIPNVTEDLLSLARRHFTTFSLGKRYSGEASALIAGWLRELSARFPNGITEAQLSKEIDFQLARTSRDAPVNHWNAATWFGVSQCPSFHPYVEKFIAQQAVPPRPNNVNRHAELLNWFQD